MNAVNYRRSLYILIALSFLIRVFLISSGGQYYWQDEQRYRLSLKAVDALWDGDFETIKRVLFTADHFLFKIIAVIPAFIEKIAGSNSRIPALFFSLFSIANLLLIWGITRRTGENERTALFAVFLYSICSSTLYYCRHLFPYDTAMCLGLFSIFTGLRTPFRTLNSILCGFFSSCTFLTYNGYWTLAGFALLIHIMHSPDYRVKRAVISGTTLIFVVTIILGVSFFSGYDLLKQFVEFSESVTQGIFSEGWKLPFLYFWHAEHFITFLWVAAFIYGIKSFSLGDRRQAIIIGLAGVILIYSSFFLFSVILKKFVVYARLVIQLVPFFCILSALFLERYWISAKRYRGKAFVVVILVLAGVQASVNFYHPLTQMFPEEFVLLASQKAALIKPGKSRIIFAHHIYPWPEEVKTGSSRIILSRKHPLQYLPYQYEGYTPGQRKRLRSTDIRMRLISDQGH